MNPEFIIIGQKIDRGLASGKLQQLGGTIFEVGTNHFIEFVRHVTDEAVLTPAFAKIQPTLKVVTGGVMTMSVSSLLTLGVASMSFVRITQRLDRIENELQTLQSELEKIGKKLDLDFYANFRAALGLAQNAFTMQNPKNQRSSALQAINRFLEAEQHYLGYLDLELQEESPTIDCYLETLYLAYLSEIRCYLELEEIQTAQRRVQEASNLTRDRIQAYFDFLLTSNPAAYLHPNLKDKIDLKRFAYIYQWNNPFLDESSVFDLQRENIFQFELQLGKWVKSLPVTIWNPKLEKRLWGSDRLQILERLPDILEKMESAIETQYRFESYLIELQAIQQLGIAFQIWQDLERDLYATEQSKVIYIIPRQNVSVTR